ncbi:MAG TPA: NTP transferase domain-containing protein, partial [Candidatus Thermoplasmatota archaeon]|nr:NTP transferase domain-containing protein [Candidatus Thermoplasmatota archaeon]
MILAGGASRRYGSDKAFALWNGKTFLRCVAEAALASCQDLLILGRSDVPIAKYHEIVPEARVRVDIK